MDTFEARIKQLRGNRTQEEFSKEIGMGRSLISDYETGRTKPTVEILEKICRKGNININWLLTGEGERFLTKEVGIREGKNTYEKKAKRIPVYSGVGCGDYMSWNNVAKEEVTFEHDIIFKVKAIGDSMADYIIEGDVLDVVQLGSKKNNQIVVVSFKTEPDEVNASAKYIRWNYPDKDHIELRSRNYRYEPSIVSLKEVYNIYKVKAIHRSIK